MNEDNEENKDWKLQLHFGTFHNTLEPLEEWIGKMNYFLEWGSKRQLFRNIIEDSNDTTEGFEDLFSTNLAILAGQINNRGKEEKVEEYASYRQELKKEFYKWIDVVGITAENCPKKLKHYLVEFHEILEGKWQKIKKELKEYIERNNIKWELDKSQDRDTLRGIFGGVQRELDNEKRNKEHGKIRFKGSEENGKNTFDAIANSLSATERESFHFFNDRPLQDDSQNHPNNQDRNNNENNNQNLPSNSNDKEPKENDNLQQQIKKIRQEIQDLKNQSNDLTEQQKKDLEKKEKKLKDLGGKIKDKASGGDNTEKPNNNLASYIIAGAGSVLILLMIYLLSRRKSKHQKSK